MTESTCVGFGARKAKQPVSALATLSRYICTYAEGWGREVILLSLEKQCHFLQMGSKRYEKSLPVCLC